jgi:hypothetical protein
MGIPQLILVGLVGRGTVEVVSSAADLNAIHSSKIGRCEGVYNVQENRAKRWLLELKV